MQLHFFSMPFGERSSQASPVLLTPIPGSHPRERSYLMYAWSSFRSCFFGKVRYAELEDLKSGSLMLGSMAGAWSCSPRSVAAGAVLCRRSAASLRGFLKRDEKQ